MEVQALPIPLTNKRGKNMIRHNSENGRFNFDGDIKCIDKSCELCHNGIIETTYYTIVSYLKQSKLLDNDYPLVCCHCWNKLGLVGRIHCEECGSLLDYGIVRHHLACNVRVICINFGCENYGTPLINKKYTGNIRDVFQYDPSKLLLEGEFP